MIKKIGIVGGIGPASTVDYYMGIIGKYASKYGPDVYPEIVIDSINLNRLMGAMVKENFDEAFEIIKASLINLKNAGADIGAVASNTPHIIWDKIQEANIIPVISIVSATCDYILKCSYKRVVVLGTEYTMKKGLYAKALENIGVTAISLSPEDMKLVGNIIYPNLENGIVIPEDKSKMISVAERYITNYNADSLLLGCTEIPIMIKAGDVSVPVINTTQIHIDAIAEKLFE